MALAKGIIEIDQAYERGYIAGIASIRSKVLLIQSEIEELLESLLNDEN